MSPTVEIHLAHATSADDDALDAICDFFERHVVELLKHESGPPIERILEVVEYIDGTMSAPRCFAFEFPLRSDPVASSTGLRLYAQVLEENRHELSSLVEMFGWALVCT